VHSHTLAIYKAINSVIVCEFMQVRCMYHCRRFFCLHHVYFHFFYFCFIIFFTSRH
jgi:hypothetical protein